MQFFSNKEQNGGCQDSQNKEQIMFFGVFSNSFCSCFRWIVIHSQLPHFRFFSGFPSSS